MHPVQESTVITEEARAVRVSGKNGDNTVVCPLCKGKKKILGMKCRWCKGTGRVPKS